MKESLEYIKTYYGAGNNNASLGTIQVNIRMPKPLINDIDFICEVLSVDRADWLRIKIAELVATEIQTRKTEIKKSASGRFLAETITEEDFEKIVGFKPPKELLEEKKKQEELNKQGTEKTKKFLRGLANRD